MLKLLSLLIASVILTLILVLVATDINTIPISYVNLFINISVLASVSNDVELLYLLLRRVAMV